MGFEETTFGAISTCMTASSQQYHARVVLLPCVVAISYRVLCLAVWPRRLCRKAAAKMYDRSTLRCVSNPSRYTRSRAQKAARWRVAVKGEQPREC
eukprot:scaffold21471_cov36-Phaeocystis_antarctica.AAC.2